MLSHAERPAADRRRFRRAELALVGRILDARGQERDCRTMDVSPGGARLVAPETPREGDRIVIYLDAIGRVPARVTRQADDDGFGVAFEATAHKREKIAEQLTWLINKDRLGLDDERRDERLAASASIAVTLEDGRALYCEVMDFSIVGASLKTAQLRPDIGAWVRLGQTYGRVSRYLEDGFAIDFQAIIPPRP
jgi:hypothetical protein